MKGSSSYRGVVDSDIVSPMSIMHNGTWLATLLAAGLIPLVGCKTVSRSTSMDSSAGVAILEDPITHSEDVFCDGCAFMWFITYLGAHKNLTVEFCDQQSKDAFGRTATESLCSYKLPFKYFLGWMLTWNGLHGELRLERDAAGALHETPGDEHFVIRICRGDDVKNDIAKWAEEKSGTWYDEMRQKIESTEYRPPDKGGYTWLGEDLFELLGCSVLYDPNTHGPCHWPRPDPSTSTSVRIYLDNALRDKGFDWELRGRSIYIFRIDRTKK